MYCLRAQVKLIGLHYSKDYLGDIGQKLKTKQNVKAILERENKFTHANMAICT